jgi:hypothetical protein
MELLVVKGGGYSDDVLQAVRVAGWRLHWMNATKHAHCKAVSKAYLWSLLDYKEVVFMELGSVFIQPLMGPFATQAAYLPGCKIWAGHSLSGKTWRSEPASNVFALMPNPKEYSRLLQLVPDNNITEQALFNAAFSSSDGSWCGLEFEKAADAASYVTLRQDWDGSHNKQVIYFSTAKPWQCSKELQPVCTLWQQEAASHTYPVTVVTSYYVGPSKHGEANYKSWGQNFLQQKVPMVIFAKSADSIPGLRIRDPQLTHVVQVDVGDFLVSNGAYEKHWGKQLAMDPEQGIHNIFLFKIWLEKTNNVLRAIDLNPFNSSHYVWMDFGGFRNPAVWQNNWAPHVERFATQNRILLLNSPVPHSDKHIGGGFFGGSIRAWDVWARLFYTRLSLELHKGTKFVADDQIMMSLIAQDYPRAVCRLSLTPIDDDVWFYMQHYLAGKTPFDGACTAGRSDL